MRRYNRRETTKSIAYVCYSKYSKNTLSDSAEHALFRQKSKSALPCAFRALCNNGYPFSVHCRLGKCTIIKMSGGAALIQGQRKGKARVAEGQRKQPYLPECTIVKILPLSGWSYHLRIYSVSSAYPQRKRCKRSKFSFVKIHSATDTNSASRHGANGQAVWNSPPAAPVRRGQVAAEERREENTAFGTQIPIFGTDCL